MSLPGDCSRLCIHSGKNCLMVIDCYLDWPTIIPMGKNITTSHLITPLTTLYSQTAVLDIFWSDGWPQSLLITFRILQRIRSSYSIQLPHTIHKVMVKLSAPSSQWRSNMNSLDWKKLERRKALQQYHNTSSRKDELSPTQKLYGHPVQDILPVHCRSYAPEWQQIIEAEQQEEATRKVTRKQSTATACRLPDIQMGSTMAVQNPRIHL